MINEAATEEWIQNQIKQERPIVVVRKNIIIAIIIISISRSRRTLLIAVR